MAGRLARIFKPHHQRAAVEPSAEHPPRSDDRLAARALADAIDRAMDMGLWAHAERIARTAARLTPRAPRLAERVARLRLAQGRPETALGIIDSAWAGAAPQASMRLLRAACLVQLGRKEEAHADLTAWSKKATAPLDARLMLALLEWETGDDHAATLALMRNLRHLEDPRSLELLLIIAAGAGRREQAARWAQRLHDCFAFSVDAASVELRCASLGLPPHRAAAEPTDDQVTMLAMELITAEQVIPSLVEAQRLQPQPLVARLIAGAIERALSDLNDQARAMEALAWLALILDERDEALGWTERGLAANPMSASLAMLAKQLADEQPAPPDVIGIIGPPAQEKAA